MLARLQLTRPEGSYGMVVALLTATATAAVLFIGVRRIEAEEKSQHVPSK